MGRDIAVDDPRQHKVQAFADSEALALLRLVA